MNAPLSNQRHEIFAHALARGETCDRAYQLAGFKANRGNASALRAKQHIQARVAQIQGNIQNLAAEKVAIDKAYVLKEAHRMYVASSDAATAETFDPKAANVAARFLDQVGNHVDVGAFAKQTDVNINITLDAAIGRLDAIEGEFTEIEK